MCLSTVYLDKKDDGAVFIKEASQIAVKGSDVEVTSLFGVSKNVCGYTIGEINLLDNYVILTPRKEA